MDKYDIRNITKEKTKAPNSISCGVTWVDGRSIFFRSKYFDSHGKFWYGVCHFSRKVWAITPLDFEKPTTINTILVSPFDNYCERAYSCINKTCPLNRFNQGMFESEYKGAGDFAREFPKGMTEKPLWFNEDPKWGNLWGKFVIDVAGGSIIFDEEKAKKLDK